MIRRAWIKYHNKRQKKACYWCKNNTERLTLDHYTPVSKGGIDELENTVGACVTCNSTKNDMLPDEWIEVLKNRKKL